ncbi:MAG: hypothetical protein Tsb0020_35120 [Haliangiales bacterium]
MTTHRTSLPALALLLFAVFSFAPTAEARTAPLPRVGVVVALDVNTTKAERNRIARAVGDALATAHPVEVTAGWDVERRLQSSEIPRSCIGSPRCMDDLAARLEADELLMLVIVQVGGDVQIEPTWYQVANRRMMSRSAIMFDAAAKDLGAVFGPIASGLRPDLEPRAGEPTAMTSQPSQPSQPSKTRVATSATSGAGAATSANAGQSVDTAGQGGSTTETFVEPDDPSQSGRYMTTGTLIATGIAATALAAGIGTTVATDIRYRRCTDGVCEGDERRTLRRHAVAADVLVGVAAVSTITAAVLYWRSAPSDSSGTEVLVTTSPHSAGFMVKGRF